MEEGKWTVRRSRVARNAVVIGLLVVGFWLLSLCDESLLAHAVHDTNKPVIYHGFGCLHLYGGDSAKAHQYFTSARENRFWPALGYIAAEVELAGRAK